MLLGWNDDSTWLMAEMKTTGSSAKRMYCLCPSKLIAPSLSRSDAISVEDEVRISVKYVGTLGI